MVRSGLKCLALSSCALATSAAADVATPRAASALVIPDAATVTMPDVEFTATSQDEMDFDKYYYFHRDGTNFAEAYRDIKECDALSSGRSFYRTGDLGYASQYGLAGALVGSSLRDAIRGSAKRRRERRFNMRSCMGYKGYARYGLAKPLWVLFNFEEGNGRKEEEVREKALQQQARVASGPKPRKPALPV